MGIFEITEKDEFKARHEIGHVLVLEKNKINWEYVTINSCDPTKGGCVKHDEIKECKENACKFVVVKMAGEAIIRFKYGRFLALSSSKYDREETKEFLKKVAPYENSNKCISRAVAENIQFFRLPGMNGKIDRFVEKLVECKKLTRHDYLNLT
ncbi:MAG: hypothetical protein EOM42_07460 [Negativicutes bacterium]|nr:hypothetical protein [Negativicutes bacterium]